MIIYKFVLSLSIAVLNCFLLSEALILAFLKNNREADECPKHETDSPTLYKFNALNSSPS